MLLAQALRRSDAGMSHWLSPGMLTAFPKLDGPARMSALELRYSANPKSGAGPVQPCGTGSVGRGTVGEVLLLSVQTHHATFSLLAPATAGMGRE